MTQVTWGRSVEKDLDRLPAPIADKFQGWVDMVRESGVREVRKIKGFHDEPLHGGRAGQRSIRLSRSYRAIYVEHEAGDVELLEVIEVNKHGY